MTTIKQGLDLPILGSPEQHIEVAKHVRRVAIIGDDHLVTAMAASLVAQLGTLAPPGQVGLDLRVNASGWEWAQWLPHLRHHACEVVAVLDGFELGRVDLLAAETVEEGNWLHRLFH